MLFSSWGEHTCLANPNNVRGPPGDHMSPPGDHMITRSPNHSLSAATDIEESILVHEDSNSCTPSTDKLPQAIALQVPVHIANQCRLLRASDVIMCFAW